MFLLEFKTSIKILCVQFDYSNVRSLKKANFHSVQKSIEKVSNLWKWRA